LAGSEKIHKEDIMG
jgi:hypothetical protein